MNCPNIEEIICFASLPPTESEAKLAAHIYTCHTCLNALSMAIEVKECNYQPTKLDLLQANNIVATNFSKQDVLKEIIEWFIKRLSIFPTLILLSEKIPYVNSRRTTTFASAARDHVKPFVQPEVCFSSNAPCSPQYYWKAILRFPAIMTTTSNLEIFVCDVNNLPLSDGILIFRGVSLNINAGKAIISVQDFQESIKGEGISVTFADGHISPGDIRLS